MKVYLGRGTNLGDKEANLHTAVQQMLPVVSILLFLPLKF